MRKLKVIPFDKGIYYIVGDVFAMQLIVTSRLSKELNFWLSNLTNDIKEPETVQQIATEYQKHRGNRLYRSLMNIIIRANEAMFKEESIMCEAIIDLFREEYDAGIEDALQRGLAQGMERGRQNGQTQMLTLVNKMLQAGDSARITKLADRNFMNEMCKLYGV